jgi:hypothetical protein
MFTASEKNVRASAGLQRPPMACAPPILIHAETSACPTVGQLVNRIDDLFGKGARTFCRYRQRRQPGMCAHHPTSCLKVALLAFALQEAGKEANIQPNSEFNRLPPNEKL